MYDLKEKRVFVSRDVNFYEHVFPYSVSNDELVSRQEPNNATQNYVDYEEIPYMPRDDKGAGEEIDKGHELDVVTDEQPIPDTGGAIHDGPNEVHNAGTEEMTGTNTSEENMGRGARQKFEPTWKKDYYCKSTRVITHNPNAHHVQAKSSRSGTRYPLENYVVTNCFSECHKAFLATIDGNVEPTYYHQAAKDGRWREAMSKEIDALEKNGTWKLVPLPRGKKPIGCKWVYKIKYRADGTVERYKARLVAHGFT
ncbi:uncharacterized protein LOC141641775 [Silene latifolia]|uniref:uncharacterized protein LOC141641775 n=1 Tax=Silene latifolia TaxID=37657 RepID=UPI003D78AC7C